MSNGSYPSTIQGAQTAGRTLKILQAIAESKTPPTLQELAEKIRLNKSVVYRITREMEEQSLIATNRDRKLVPASGLYAMAAQILGDMDLRQVVRPFLLRIAKMTGQSVALHLRDRQNRVCIDNVEGIQPSIPHKALGLTFPLYAGSSGKTILAFLTADDAEPILIAGVDAGIDRSRVEEELAQIREDGFTIQVDKRSGLAGLSVPLFNADGVVACITVVGPAERWSPQVMAEASSEVMAVVKDCSLVLGAHDRFPEMSVL